MRFTILRSLLIPAFILTTSSVLFAQLDPSFGSGGVTTTNINSNDRPIGSFLLPDQKILVVTESFQTSVRYHFLRFNSDGTPDMSYGTGGKIELTGLFISQSSIYGINQAVRQEDGKILIVGTDNFDGFVARFNENATLDTTFATGGIHRPNINQSDLDTVESAVVQSDGKIVIGGTTSTPSRLFLLRYHQNGLLDTSFGDEGYIIHTFNLPARRMFLQSSGKILVSSGDARHTGTSNPTIRRFNADGTSDASFSTISFGPTLRATAVQSDDKILAGEVIRVSDPLEREHDDVRVTRYSADGAVDTGFGTGGFTQFDLTSSKHDDSPNGMIVAPDGSIIVSVITLVQPNRTQMRGPMVALTRLTSGGTVSGKFLETKSLSVYDAFLSIYPDGKILNVFQTVSTGNNIDLLLTRATGVPLQNYKFRGVPFDFSFSLQADGRSDPTIFRPSDSKWYFFPQGVGFPFGLSTDILVASDYIKDTGAERAIFRPSEGRWYIARTYFDPNAFVVIQWGLAGDIPAPGDFDGDTKSDPTVFRPSDGVWYIRRSSDDSPQFVRWGTNGDKPTPGDFDGDGLDDVAVFRPSGGDWYILRSSDGQPVYVHFGLDGDIPVQEDYDGDGKTDIAVWRPSTGIWYRLNSSDGSYFALNWGLPTDLPTPGDYDGDLKIDIAIWRPSQGRWYIYQSSTSGMATVNWGLPTDAPVSAKN